MFEVKGGNAFKCCAYARSEGAKAPRRGGRAEVQLAGHKTLFLPTQQWKGAIPC